MGSPDGRDYLGVARTAHNAEIEEDGHTQVLAPWPEASQAAADLQGASRHKRKELS